MVAITAAAITAVDARRSDARCSSDRRPRPRSYNSAVRLCVFCGSSSGLNPAFIAATRVLGAELALRGIEVVYGGGNVGLMGVLADAALSAGGRVIGVIPHALVARELAHQGLTALHVVNSMHERKALMAELADGFVALPGGFGTLEEFCEAVTWTQLGVPSRAACSTSTASTMICWRFSSTRSAKSSSDPLIGRSSSRTRMPRR